MFEGLIEKKTMEHKRSLSSLDQSSFVNLIPKRLKTDVALSPKDKKEKVSERISALQQLVSPFGKTDAASILSEAIGYIKFLHEQVKVLIAPYLRLPARLNSLSLHYSLCVIATDNLCTTGHFAQLTTMDVSQNITRFRTANQLIVEKSGGQCNLPLGFEYVQYGHEIEQRYPENEMHFSGIDDVSIIDKERKRNSDDAINVEDEAQNIVDVSFEDGTERDRSSKSFHVSYDQLKSQFGKSRKDAAENLGVSISTLKRKCRDYSIYRWPSKMNNIKNPSLFRTSFANKCVENADHQKTTELANICQAADVVIKVKFKDETLKFEYCVSRGVEKLMEEVSKRLNLKFGKFKLKYTDDDDGDLISLTCDEDLDFYVKTMKSIGKTTVQVLVHLIFE